MEKKGTIPFLLQKATRVAEDRAPSAPSSDTKEAHAKWFHTRCGHPRRRDD